MRKSPRPSVLLDKLHRGAVITCIGVTICGFVYGGYRWYNYFAVIRPARLAAKAASLAEEIPRPPIDTEELRS